jgi:hypothetical protein
LASAMGAAAECVTDCSSCESIFSIEPVVSAPTWLSLPPLLA